MVFSILLDSILLTVFSKKSGSRFFKKKLNSWLQYSDKCFSFSSLFIDSHLKIKSSFANFWKEDELVTPCFWLSSCKTCFTFLRSSIIYTSALVISSMKSVLPVFKQFVHLVWVRPFCRSKIFFRRRSLVGIGTAGSSPKFFMCCTAEPLSTATMIHVE